MPEDQAGSSFFLNTEKIEFNTELAMIAALRFFQAMQILIKFLLSVKGGSVNALKLRISFLPLPICASHAHQFEGGDASGGRDVRSTAEIDKFSGGVKGNHGLDSFFFHELAFESLVRAADKALGLRASAESFRSLGRSCAARWRIFASILARSS